MSRDRAEKLIPTEVGRRTVISTTHPIHGRTQHEVVKFEIPGAGSWTWTVVVVYTDTTLTYSSARAQIAPRWLRKDEHEAQLDRLRNGAQANDATFRIVADDREG